MPSPRGTILRIRARRLTCSKRTTAKKHPRVRRSPKGQLICWARRWWARGGMKNRIGMSRGWWGWLARIRRDWVSPKLLLCPRRVAATVIMIRPRACRIRASLRRALIIHLIRLMPLSGRDLSWVKNPARLESLLEESQIFQVNLKKSSRQSLKISKHPRGHRMSAKRPKGLCKTYCFRMISRC